MNAGAIQKWQILCVTVVMANPQFPMPNPMFGPPPMMSHPPSMIPASPINITGSLSMLPSPLMSMPMQIGLAIVDDETATTTTTTAKPDNLKNEEIAIALPIPMSFQMPPPMPMPGPMPGPMPMPMPMPMPALSPMMFAVPGMMSSVCQKNKNHPNCPPCPPCSCSPCTPSFFSYCSPCHQKCRCRKPEDVPIVLPPKAPFPFPGPAFPMPYPGLLPNSPKTAYIPFMPKYSSYGKSKYRPSKVYNSDSESYEDCKESAERMHKGYYNYGRAGKRLDLDRSDDMDARPVLSFLTEDGKVKMNRLLSKADASILTNDYYEYKPDIGGNNRSYRQRSIKNTKQLGKKKLVVSYPYVNNGRKQMVFQAPPGMRIGNLSVSFNT